MTKVSTKQSPSVRCTSRTEPGSHSYGLLEMDPPPRSNNYIITELLVPESSINGFLKIF